MAKRRRMIDTSVPEDELEARPSRSEKRALQRDLQTRLETLGLRLTTLTERALTSLDLGEATEREVRLLATLTSGSALSRQRRRVAALLRSPDLEETERRIEEAAGENTRSRASTYRLERLRRELLDGGDEALSRLFETHPGLPRQQLRKAVRAARREAEGGATGRHFRALFQLLKELALEAA